MADTAGRAVEIPIKSAFIEGLDALEYFISSHGARKGLADTALRTANAGYLTRRLVDVSQDIIVREEDCGTTEGVTVRDIVDDGRVIEKLEDRIRGRYALKAIKDPESKKTIVAKDELITEELAKEIVNAGITEVEVRSVVGCKCLHGICKKCYGSSLSSKSMVNLGETLGIVAAQAIGEPGTQLTMRTFHGGGVAGGDVTQGLPRVEELFEARKPKGVGIIAEIDGTVTISYDEEGLRDPEITITGKDEVRTYSANQKILSNIANPELDEKGKPKKVKVIEPGDSKYMTSALVNVVEFEKENQKLIEEGKKPAEGKQILLGITKASLATDSFLSAASFQETTKVLTDAAIKGKVDDLIGVKENVIIGKLIPAGTGFTDYRELTTTTAIQDEAVAKIRAEREAVESGLREEKNRIALEKARQEFEM